MDYKLHHGDCLEVMKTIPDCSIDLILTDPPYGTIKGLAMKGGELIAGYRDNSWDERLDTAAMFQEMNRILRPNGKAILFSQEPYTSQLIQYKHPSLPFIYRAIWLKNIFGNKLVCKKAMVSLYEDICIFSKKPHDDLQLHPLRNYFLEERDKCEGVNFKELLGNGMATHYFTGGTQFQIPTLENYKKLQKTGHFQRDYDELKAIDEEFRQRYASVFNLWQGGKTKANVLEYKKDSGNFHPTQKPVALLEDLIQTFSNEGDTVLDFTMGSGSTGVACVNTGRNFIGIEKKQEYYDIAVNRIGSAVAV